MSISIVTSQNKICVVMAKTLFTLWTNQLIDICNYLYISLTLLSQQVFCYINVLL